MTILETSFSIRYELPAEGTSLPGELDAWQKHRIMQAMRRAGGVKAQAADLLGIERTTLCEKMKRLGLSFAKGAGH